MYSILNSIPLCLQYAYRDTMPLNLSHIPPWYCFPSTIATAVWYSGREVLEKLRSLNVSILSLIMCSIIL